MITSWHLRALHAAGIDEPAMQADFEASRKLFAKHGRSYYLATTLLAPDRRPWVWALYGFARYADELVDDTHGPSAEGLAALTDQVNAGLARPPGAPGRRPEHEPPVLRALLHTINRHGIEPVLMHRFLRSMQMDLTVTEYPGYPELCEYMAGSAAAIGLWMLPILRPLSADAEQPAATLGEAFQLTNFIRDVGEDLDRGRIYLPLEDLAAHGVTRDLLCQSRSQGQAEPAVRALVAFEVERAEGLYRAAEPGIDLLHPSSRPAIRAAYTLYHGILTQVRAQQYDVFRRRATVGVPGRLAVYARARNELRRHTRDARNR